ncbi:MAG TPA: ABC transporter substrate-binding protein [Chloroflexota bacterium]|nr:ABC transporter substrate-binding protein [Chloroflexota bacterium]
MIGGNVHTAGRARRGWRQAARLGLGALGTAALLACAAPAPTSAPAAAPAGATPVAERAGGPPDGAEAGEGAAAPVATREPTDVTVAIVSASTAQLPYYVGLKGGFFEQEGVRLTLTLMPTPLGIASAIDGAVGYTTSGGSVIRAAASGRPIRLIAGGKNAPDWNLAVQPAIGSVAELRGKRIGVLEPTGASTLVTFEVLDHHGVAKGDVESINLHNTEGILAGLLAGAVDGGLISPPFTVYARRQGLKELVRTADEVEVLQGGLGTSVQRLQERPAEVNAVLRGLLRATRALHEDRALVVQTMAEQFELEPSVAADMYDDVALSFTPDATASDAVIRREIAAQAAAVGQELAVAPRDVADFGPLQRAQAALAAAPAGR